MLLTNQGDDRLWLMEMARSAVTGCFCAANVFRTVLLTSSSLMIYQGYDLPILTSISADASLWHHVQIPPAFLANQQPIRCAVISSDGRYLAVAGRRGLAHYSVSSGRWKTFDDPEDESSFVVRGGMCWYQHILIAAVETDEHHEVAHLFLKRCSSMLIRRNRFASTHENFGLIARQSSLSKSSLLQL